MPPTARRLGTVGRAVPGIDVAIIGDDGTPLPTGENGEIAVRGPNIMQGYWNDQEQTGQAVVDGWFRTGDVGHLDADGYITIVDRKKDLILRGGYNVYPRDVEDVLIRHPDVVGAVVVGRPDDRLGEEVVAFVALRPGVALDSAALVAFAREHISANKYPREIKVVDAIPLTSVGKVDRKRVRALVRDIIPTA
jgi:long-chain acyl-CoA synthetase